MKEIRIICCQIQMYKSWSVLKYSMVIHLCYYILLLLILPEFYENSVNGWCCYSSWELLLFIGLVLSSFIDREMIDIMVLLSLIGEYEFRPQRGGFCPWSLDLSKGFCCCSSFHCLLNLSPSSDYVFFFFIEGENLKYFI